MSDLAPAIAALEAGDRERAKAILVQAYDRAPGDAAAMLARIALDDGDYARAEALSRTAIENHALSAAITLADAVGRQGRRAEAEEIALAAMSSNADSGRLRAILGEQRVRQANWDLGTQDFIDALSLDERDIVVEHLWRVTRDLTIGHRAEKVPSARALQFIDRIEASAPSIESLELLFDRARAAIANGTTLDEAPRAAAKSTRRAPPPLPRGANHHHHVPAMTGGRAPDLVATMRRDRELNERLQAGLDKLGLPSWPSKHPHDLDPIGPMSPKNLKIDRAEFQREQLNVTSGSVASEIIVERALQSLLRALGDTTAAPPTLDGAGVTKLEVALWDGILSQMTKIPTIYLGDHAKVDERVLGLGAFLGACVVRPGDATWSFEREPAAATIETSKMDLEPMAVAARWVAANDKDDVHLEEFLEHARLHAGLVPMSSPRLDPCEGLEGRALAMKLAELWIDFRPHPLDTAQNVVADAIRPLNVLPGLIFFALDSRFAPKQGPWTARGRKIRGEVAIAYVRRTGEFLILPSRKHFARAVGIACGKLTKANIATILELFVAFHYPGARAVEADATLEQRADLAILEFTARSGGEERGYALAHMPKEPVPWRLLEA